MSLIGTFHEISMYGLIANIVCLVTGKVGFQELWYSALHPAGFIGIFLCYLFWASVLYIPIAIIGAFSTKYHDHGEGLTFFSNNILVIILAHIGEEIIGLIASPFWFLKDLYTGQLLDKWKVIDYIVYLILIIFIALGMLSVFKVL